MTGFSQGRLLAASADDLTRSVSANEKMITRFQKELSGADEAKKRSLQTKIASLEQQNKGLRIQLGRVPAAPQASAPTQGQTPGSDGYVRKSFDDMTGLDWEQMAPEDKQRFVYTAIGSLEQQGVFVSRTPQEYVEEMDRVLKTEPSLSSEYLDSLFVFCVYDNEPQTRPALSRIRDEARTAQEE